jgi:hypothetical protein
MPVSLAEAKKILHEHGFSQVRKEGNALRIETIAKGDDPVEYRLVLKYDEKQPEIVVEGAWVRGIIDKPGEENDITLTWEDDNSSTFIEEKVAQLERLLKVRK